MKFDLSNTRIFIRPGTTDLRISTVKVIWNVLFLELFLEVRI